jgi:hypothetical protein
MAKTKRVLSLFVVALMTVFTVLSYVPAKAATAAPKLSVVTQPAAEYTPDQTISFTVNAHYAGKVMYRVILYNGTTKLTSNLWNTPKTGYYYTKWTPSGTMNFNIHWAAKQLQPGYYSMTVLAKKVGSKAKYDTYVDTHSFLIKNEEATISSIADITATVDEGGAYTLPATVSAKMSDDTTKDVAVVWTPATVDTTKVGDQTFTGKVEGYDKDVKLTLTVKAVPLAVTSVSAINAKQIQVTFNKPVSAETVLTDPTASSTTLKVGAVTLARTTTSDVANENATLGSAPAVLSANGKVLTLTIASTAYLNGTYAVVVNDSILGADGETLAPYTTVVSMKDTVKPAVLAGGVTYDPSTRQITVKFTEPLSIAPIIRVNGTPVSLDTFTAPSATVTTTGTLPITAGTNASVYVNGAVDYTSNVMDAYNTTVNIPNDTNPLTVTATAAGNNTVRLVFNKALSSTTANIQSSLAVLCGANVYTNGVLGTAFGVTQNTTVDPSGKTYDVTLNLGGGRSPNYGLYTSTVTTKNITIYFAANSLTDVYGVKLGEFTQGITMTKDTTGPTLVSQKVSDDKKYFILTFNENLLLADASKIIVTNGNGVRVPVVTSKTENTKVSTTDATQLFVDIATGDVVTAAGTYNIKVNVGAVTDALGNDLAAAVNVPALTVGSAASTLAATITNAKAGDLGGTGTTPLNNKFLVSYDSAVTTATGILSSNYSLDGAALPANTDIYFTDATQQKVAIVLPANSINIGTVGTGTNAVLSVRNVATSNGVVVTPASTLVKVEDNTPAELVSAQLTGNTLTLTFNENLGTVPADIDQFLADFAIKGDSVSFAKGTANVATAAITKDGNKLYVTIIPATGRHGSNWATMKAASVLTVGTNPTVVNTTDADTLPVDTSVVVNVSK